MLPTTEHQAQYHQLSLLELASHTLLEVNFPTFDMFLQCLSWKPTSFVDTVLCCESFKITLPRSPEEWNQVTTGFANLSCNELFGGCHPA